MTERDFLREQLQLLTKAHYDAVQPLLKRLAKLEAMTAKPPYAWSSQDGLQHFEEGVAPAPPNTWTVLGLSFRQAWRKREQEGYRWGAEALEHAQAGWDLALETCKQYQVAHGADKVAPPAPVVRPSCSCFPGTCREQVDKSGVTVSGNRCKAAKPKRPLCGCVGGVCDGRPVDIISGMTLFKDERCQARTRR